MNSTITFTLEGDFTDSGGLKRDQCTPTTLAPNIKYVWALSLPPGYPQPPPPLPTILLTGEGRGVSVVAKVLGNYSATFTVSTDRDCPAATLVYSKTAEAKEVDLEFATVSDVDEENPGGFLCVNNDDDNNNGIPDKGDAGPIVGEDDLRKIMLTVPTLTEGKVTLSNETPAGSPSTAITIHEFNNRVDNPFTLPLCWSTTGEANCDPLSMMPSELWVQGVAASSAARDVELTLKYENGTMTCEDVVNLTVFDIQPISAVFSGPSFRAIAKDNGSGNYGTPHWQVKLSGEDDIIATFPPIYCRFSESWGCLSGPLQSD